MGNSGFIIQMEVNKLAFHRQVDYAGTKDLMKKIDRLAREYREKTGKKLEDVLPCTVMWGAMDTKSIEYLNMQGHTEESVSYR